MTIHTTRLGSFIGPVWQEISSLWSGVDFSFSDSLPDLEQPAHFADAVPEKSPYESNPGRAEPCW
jgi:hypothetical protein